MDLQNHIPLTFSFFKNARSIYTYGCAFCKKTQRLNTPTQKVGKSSNVSFVKLKDLPLDIKVEHRESYAITTGLRCLLKYRPKDVFSIGLISASKIENICYCPIIGLICCFSCISTLADTV